MGANKLQVETERVTIRDSAFDFNTGSFTRRLKIRVRHYHLGRTPKSGGTKGEENIIREVIWPYLDRQIATAEKKVSIPERS
ncbi:MAG TPA: hypothetical protein VLJ79_20045 [Candidatus Binatia bacterium]|nr:hypothetical protein [Candidatus Binatia bacterium]